MVKVLGFFAGKKGGASMENAGVLKKPPVVVVRFEKPRPEIRRPETEITEACEAGCTMKKPIVEASSVKSRPKIVLPNMEIIEACDEGNKDLDFQEINQ
nr:hypothetical protein CFP56_05590 [Quercus suber]